MCEKEDFPSIILKERFNVPNLGDITKVRWEEVEPVDIIVGGFPCQDISVAGKQEGIREGNRSGLWYEFAKAIRILRPRYAFVENVSALVRNGLDIVLAELAKIGYDAKWTSVRASDAGAPHKRERVFILATDSSSIGHDSEGYEQALGQGSVPEEWEAEAGSQREEWFDEARQPCADVADSFNCGCRGRSQEQSEEEYAAEAQGRSADEDVSDTSSQRDFSRTIPNEQRKEGSDAHRGSEELSNASFEGLEVGRDQEGQVARCSRRSDYPDWSVEPNFRLLVDGNSLGMDDAQYEELVSVVGEQEAKKIARKVWEERIKMCGNGVVPAQAALAWKILWRQELY